MTQLLEFKSLECNDCQNLSLSDDMIVIQKIEQMLLLFHTYSRITILMEALFPTISMHLAEIQNLNQVMVTG